MGIVIQRGRTAIPVGPDARRGRHRVGADFDLTAQVCEVRLRGNAVDLAADTNHRRHVICVVMRTERAGSFQFSCVATLLGRIASWVRRQPSARRPNGNRDASLPNGRRPRRARHVPSASGRRSRSTPDPEEAERLRRATAAARLEHRRSRPAQPARALPSDAIHPDGRPTRRLPATNVQERILRSDAARPNGPVPRYRSRHPSANGPTPSRNSARAAAGALRHVAAAVQPGREPQRPAARVRRCTRSARPRAAGQASSCAKLTASSLSSLLDHSLGGPTWGRVGVARATGRLEQLVDEKAFPFVSATIG